MNEEKNNISSTRIRNLLANERTFLAWIRTCLGIMAFGFVIEKFGLFIKQIEAIFSAQNLSQMVESPITREKGASHFGILLIGFGAIVGLLAFIRYHKARKQIEKGMYHSSPSLAGALTAAILIAGAFLIYYIS